MANEVTMAYGTYSFSPVPFVTLEKEYNKTEADEQIGASFRITLEGIVTPLPDSPGGFIDVDALQDELREAMSTDGQLFKIMCGSTTIMSAHPRVVSLQFARSSDNWVQTTPFTINLEWDEEPTGSGEDSFTPFLKSVKESWNLETVEDRAYYNWDLGGTPDAAPYTVRLTHNVSAVGKRHYISGGGTSGTLQKPAWEQARDWVIPRLGYDSSQITSSGVINLDTSDFVAYNHVRTQSVDETAGEFAVTESWIAITPNASGVNGRATEDFTVSIRTSLDSDITAVSIEGTIQGLETRSYGTSPGDFDISESKYDAAVDYWSTVQTKLVGRVNKVLDGDSTRTINPIPHGRSVGHAVTNGTITYTYEYDDRPCNFISGALSEVITVNDNDPTDVFASLTILGRAAGPILQDIGTITAATREVSIELVMPIPTGCDSGNCGVLITSSPKNQVNALLCCLEGELTDAYNQVFKSQDNSSWSPKTGRYTRTVQWTYSNCSGYAPSTSFC